MTPEELARIEAAKEGIRRIYGSTTRFEGESAENPLGYAITHVAHGQRIFTTLPDIDAGWIVDADENIIHVTGDGADVRAVGNGNIQAIISAAGTLRLNATTPTTENFVRQSGDYSQLVGSASRDVVDTRGSRNARGVLGAGDDEVRIDANTTNASFRGGAGRDSINLNALPVNSDIIAVFNANTISLVTTDMTPIGQFGSFSHVTRGSDAQSIAQLLATHADSEGFAQGIIHVENDGSLQFVPLSALPANSQTR